MNNKLAKIFKNKPDGPKKKGSPNYRSGDFLVYNPKKYFGDLPIKYRSSYELLFMHKIEANSNVLRWSSENVVIPYLMKEKIDGKFVDVRHNYITDFTVILQDGTKFICEVKPLAFTPLNEAQIRNSPVHYKNAQKWKYAMRWCTMNGYKFKIINESHLKTKVF